MLCYNASMDETTRGHLEWLEKQVEDYETAMTLSDRTVRTKAAYAGHARMFLKWCRLRPAVEKAVSERGAR